MAADLFHADAEFRALVQRAGEHVGVDLAKICLRGPEKMLRCTAYLQPLLVAVSLGYLRHLTGHGVTADVLLGHSLGEITALGAGGVVSVEDAVLMAAKRGQLMEAVAGRVHGGMLAVTTAHRERVLQLVDGLQVVLANDNTPQQFVLSGELVVLERIARQISQDQLGRSQLLPVNGPWHSPFMAAARTEFATWVVRLNFQVPRVPLILNATGTAETDPATIKRHVIDTLAGPVQWRRCLECLRAMQPRQLYEIGPGRVLSGLARANGFGFETRVWNINNLRGIQSAITLPAAEKIDPIA